MDTQMVNFYIEKLLEEITELTKQKILLRTQLAYTEKINAELNEKLSAKELPIEKPAKKSKQQNNDSEDF